MNLPDQQFVIALSHLICARQYDSHYVCYKSSVAKGMG